MALFDKKIRLIHYSIPLILLLVLFSFTGNSFRRAPWYEEALWYLLSPFERLFTGASSGAGGVWEHYVALVGVQEANEALVKRVGELEASLIRAREVEEENKRLRALLAWHDSFSAEKIVARVIANEPRAEFKSIMINRGSADGISPLMPVLGPKGLVGKIGKTSAHAARVLLITDPNSSVDAMVQRSRARGIAVGSAWNTELKAGYYLTRLEYLRGVSDVQDGDVVVTSGLDAVFPPGIPIGTIHDIRMSRYGVFRDANIVPFEEMAELEEVIVLQSRPDVSSNAR